MLSHCILAFTTLTLCWLGISVESRAADISQIPDSLPVSTADLMFNYRTDDTKDAVTEVQTGRYAFASPLSTEYGKLVHVLTVDGANHGCVPFVNAPDNTEGKWIALIQRGSCKFHQKVINAAFFHNASAVIVYNNIEDDHLLIMQHFIDDVVSVFIHKEDGEHLAELVDSGLDVYVNVTLQKVEMYMSSTGAQKAPYKVQPLLIISVTMITCLIVGLTALLVCGIRRAKSQRMKSSRRHIVFTVNDTAAHQRLLMSDVHDYMMEPNNNDPNHNHLPCHQQQH